LSRIEIVGVAIDCKYHTLLEVLLLSPTSRFLVVLLPSQPKTAKTLTRLTLLYTPSLSHLPSPPILSSFVSFFLFLFENILAQVHRPPSMSEVQTRPAPSARGRGSSRGGRGGSSFGSRGGARNIATNGVSHDGIDENSDLGQIKKRYNEQLERLKEMFPDLNSEDILFELQENAGDLQVTASKITEGSFTLCLHSLYPILHSFIPYSLSFSFWE
jgi:hypothetical protein